MTRPLDPSRSIFEEPPDDMSERFGVLLLNWNGQTGREPWETARAYRIAADRLLAVARGANETWESADPIMFCYRHAVELHLKALLAPDVAHTHGLEGLIAGLRARLERYRERDVSYLCSRLVEFAKVDPRSTAFRYTDATPPGREPELWLDLNRLSAIMDAIFGALERIRLDFIKREAAP
jgi:hypothetical protein